MTAALPDGPGRTPADPYDQSGPVVARFGTDRSSPHPGTVPFGQPEPTAGYRVAPLPPRQEAPAYQAAPPYQAAGPYHPAASGYPQTGYPQTGYPQTGYPQTGYPQTGYPQTGYPHGGSPAWGPPAAPPSPPAPARPRRSPVLVLLVAALVAAVGVQAFFLVDLDARLAAANRQRAADKAAGAKAMDALTGRVKALEQRAAASLDSAAVAAAVLPSVFRVDAGNFSGSAFAIRKAGTGGTDLLTNYHVVAALYRTGGRAVSLQHDNQRFPARIVRVDQGQDLALLHAAASFPRLAAAAKQVASGAPIIVVGAPLRLAQSVTSGIVSAVRNDVPGEPGKTFIQFSAPINPGNSGGPVIDAQKQVVGIASAKANDAEGIGLAIPIHVACASFTVC
jgi:putative serine protease PepD